MAHYKRGKCRNNHVKSIRGSEASWRAKMGLRPIRPTIEQRWWGLDWHPYISRMDSWPAWWDRTFHIRPRRAAAKRLERQVMQGADPDGLVWPLGNSKPHKYYW